MPLLPRILRTAQDHGGSSLWRLVELVASGPYMREVVPHDAVRWDELDRVGFRYNRLLIYNARRSHRYGRNIEGSTSPSYTSLSR